MWYEILPCAAIIYATLAIPNYGIYWINKLCMGVPYKRDIGKPYDYHYFIRDYSLSGSPFKQIGLEAIPDEDSSTSKKD